MDTNEIKRLKAFQLAAMRLKSQNEQLEAKKEHLERERDRLKAVLAAAHAEIAAIEASHTREVKS